MITDEDKDIAMCGRGLRVYPEKPHVLQIRPDGSITHLYNEAIPLRELGPLKMERLSEIYFDEGLQLWRVMLMENSRVIFQHPSRQACVDFETDYFNRQLLSS